MELAGGGSCSLLLSGAVLHLDSPGMAQPAREEDLSHSSLLQGTWAQQLPSLEHPLPFPLANGLKQPMLVLSERA